MKTAFRASPLRGTKGAGIIPLIKGAQAPQAAFGGVKSPLGARSACESRLRDGSEEIVILTPEVRACPMGEKAPPAMPQDLTSATDGGSVNVLKMSTVVSRICSTSFKKEWGL